MNEIKFVSNYIGKKVRPIKLNVFCMKVFFFYLKKGGGWQVVLGFNVHYVFYYLKMFTIS